MALNNGLRSCASKFLNSSAPFESKQVIRGFHSSGMKMMAEGHGHGHGHDEPFYIHAKHMYNLDRMKLQQVKMPLFVWTCVGIGIFVPIYAVVFQQSKTASA
ncbi:hypothetical protein Nepgr_024251 [Nepenthes gracilis]|uniref:Uncharacterized protein n=1 Tax=Nepenthes gracilis TaxID=150966 RepID=A0AAD3XYM1_NEPGR|nr:hypothetical protein Nepgr_024251 [Nepenthes gracilis]